jgi:hypothetical protein
MIAIKVNTIHTVGASDVVEGDNTTLRAALPKIILDGVFIFKEMNDKSWGNEKERK